VIKEILLPDLGEGIEGAEVSEVSVSVGKNVVKDDIILVLESDKASMEIPTDFSGEVLDILVSPGDEVKTGQRLITIKVDSEDKKKTTLVDSISDNTEIEEVKIQEPIEEKIIEVNNTEVIGRSSNKSFASPGVRKLSRELGINLDIISGTGQKNRITKDDLHSYIKIQMSISSGSKVVLKKEIDFSQWGKVEVLKLTRINKITGNRLQEAWQEIPHVTQYDKADITEIDTLRKKLKLEGGKKDIKVTFLPFLMKAVSIVLREMPKFNSSLDHTDQNLILKKYYHIGVAIDTPNGLTVPCVRNVEEKGIFDLSKELMDLSEKARNKKLKPEDLKGSTFTISSLGGIGGTAFSPIVNPPEVAIMGVSKSEWCHVYNKETKEFDVRYLMPFSISYDHRVIDGAAAATFTTRLSQVLLNTDNFKE
jgi:pyruvate dehydrogenase E2 component (dihydrolipoamide acetyltransferase)|tara:strand:- start:323 stop:1588 length:1266 start_codon:yes stop_codon:yes gene_type:complete